LKKPLPQSAHVALLQEAMRRAAAARLERGRTRAAALERGLAHLNPRAVLERGYAIVTNADGGIVYDAATPDIGNEVALAFARGDAGAKSPGAIESDSLGARAVAGASRRAS
jgi:exodeoxyribonuclease VII large subunit